MWVWVGAAVLKEVFKVIMRIDASSLNTTKIITMAI
jgi:hypothetical protein